MGLVAMSSPGVDAGIASASPNPNPNPNPGVGVGADESMDPASWAQLAVLKPQLRPHLEFYLHHYRGQPWYVLADELAGNYFRLPAAAFQLLSLLDGRHTVAEAYAQLAQTGVAPSHYEVAVLLGKLHNARLLQGDMPAAAVGAAQQPLPKSSVWQRLRQPLMQRVALIDPDRLLSRLLPWVQPVFSPVGFMLWLLVVLSALLLVGQHSGAISQHLATRFTDPVNILLLGLAYPLIKALHELAHGFATKVWGGEVHEMGLMFIVFIPLPYVDATASNGFYSKRRRILVASAGIMAELWLAGVAFLLWSQLDTGLLKDFCFNVAVIGSVSTLLFNGNPLLRFDGYYILMDMLEIPNLGSRSTQYLGYLCKRYLYGFTQAASPVRAEGERGWLLGYGVAAGIYRLFISLVIALYVASQFFFIGVVLALWALANQWLLPTIKIARSLWQQAQQAQLQKRLLAVTGGLALALLLMLFVVPVSDSSYAQGVVSLPEQSIVRAGADGFMVAVQARDGDEVQVGQPLFSLTNYTLAQRSQRLQAYGDELAARYQQALVRDPAEAQKYAADQRLNTQGLADVRQQLASLQLLSPVAGVLSMVTANDMPGRYVKQGDILAYVIDKQYLTARVVVSQADVDKVRRHTQAVQVKMHNRPQQTWQASIVREVPQASMRLPSRSLGTQGGGNIAVDARDDEGLAALNSLFQFDIILPALSPEAALPHRLSVRFIHTRRPLAQQGLAWLQQFLMTRFQI